MKKSDVTTHHEKHAAANLGFSVDVKDSDGPDTFGLYKHDSSLEEEHQDTSDNKSDFNNHSSENIDLNKPAVKTGVEVAHDSSVVSDSDISLHESCDSVSQEGSQQRKIEVSK